MPKLIVINQRGLTKLVPLHTGQTTVGRGSLNSVVIDAESVSRHHAVLTRQGATVRLQDLNSRNGTYVNDVRVRTRRLRHGDSITMGDCVLRFLDATPVQALDDPLDLQALSSEFHSVYGAPQPAPAGWDAQP
ncbi:FHA domain-containing protein [Variovorax sp. ZT4R33]|uniref:FHA domain-containing protein n=1 Tax=Variovorax sp. ZT4R33 TaxID=3443743 RepID=UPI003F488402